MKYLLDTHIALWLLEDSEKLSNAARKIIQAVDNEIYASYASLWEIAIKHKKYPNEMPISSKKMQYCLRQSNVLLLPIGLEHIIATENLPDIHKDPFDRLLIAQAITEPMHFLTHDEKLSAYSELVQLV
ncbi:MAG: type II toxin-antitoxin system VapC family toxin [Cardiobacteriaceae bacterium]|nr:type II toxin-antitoxin system VapC family toxin [Cardiobacteriaceae bacterium]